MEHKVNTNNHTCKATEILKGLSENVSAHDKKAAARELNISENTVGNYLRGKVGDLSLAERLIVYLHGCVKRREAIFSELSGQPVAAA